MVPSIVNQCLKVISQETRGINRPCPRGLRVTVVNRAISRVRVSERESVRVCVVVAQQDGHHCIAERRVVAVAVFDCICTVTGKSVVNLLGIRVQSASLHAFGDSLGNRAATHGEVTALRG